MYQDYENYVDLEQTPEMYPAQPPEPVKPVTGNVGSCYICGLDVLRVPSERMVKKIYDGFFLTICAWCDHDLCK